MTPEMIAKARTNAEILGLANVEFVLGEIETLPLAHSSVDLVISNGVFNLCSDKPKFSFRRFGGRSRAARRVKFPPANRS